MHASDQASLRHRAAMVFLEGRVEDPDLPCLAWSTLMGYLRIATHPSIFGAPLSPAEALGNVDALLQLPRVRILTEQDGFLEVYREVAGKFPVRGNLVSDAHLAALLRQHGVRTIYATDADFRKFDFLEPIDPLAG